MSSRNRRRLLKAIRAKKNGSEKKTPIFRTIAKKNLKSIGKDLEPWIFIGAISVVLVFAIVAIFIESRETEQTQNDVANETKSDRLSTWRTGESNRSSDDSISESNSRSDISEFGVNAVDGRRWSQMSFAEKGSFARTVRQRLAKRFPDLDSDWIIDFLNKYYAGGNGRDDNAIELLAIGLTVRYSN